MTTPARWGPEQQRLFQRIIDTIDAEAGTGRIHASARAKIEDGLCDLAASVAAGDAERVDEVSDRAEPEGI